MQLAHLNWQEAEKVLADPETLVVIPVGSTEQHGSVGPLGTDWLIPQELCRRLDGRMEKLLIAPVKVIREIRDTVNTGGLGGLESKFATREWGVAMMDGVTDWMVRYLEAFRRIDLPKKHWD